MVSKAKYTLVDIARDLKMVILPSRDKYPLHHNVITLQIFLTAVEKFISF